MCTMSIMMHWRLSFFIKSEERAYVFFIISKMKLFYNYIISEIKNMILYICGCFAIFILLDV